MTGMLKDLTYNREGKQVLSITLDGDFREQFDQLNGVTVTVDVKKHHRKRSLNANAYAWVLIDKLAQKLGLRKEDVYRAAIRDIGGVSNIVTMPSTAVEAFRLGWSTNGIGWQTEVVGKDTDGCATVIIYYGSSTYNTQQMSQLIDILIEECKEQGIETMTPEELERLIGYARCYA